MLSTRSPQSGLQVGKHLIPTFPVFHILHSEISKCMVQLTSAGRTGPTAIYIHTEGTGKILVSFKLITVDNTVTANVLGFTVNNSSRCIQQWLWNNHAYYKLWGKED
jgi:hypothetical protein